MTENKMIIPLIESDEVKHIVTTHFECDEDCDAKVELLMSRLDDGTIKQFIYDTFDTWAFSNFWDVVESAVTDWADDVIGEAINTNRE